MKSNNKLWLQVNLKSLVNSTSNAEDIVARKTTDANIEQLVGAVACWREHFERTHFSYAWTILVYQGLTDDQS